MQLCIDDFKKITSGAAYVSEEGGKIRFHRFTQEEESFYKERDAALGTDHCVRCAVSAGIKLAFKTDSKKMKLSATLTAATSRTFFSFDVFENGKLIGYLDNFDESELLENYTAQSFPLGKYEKEFTLSGENSEIVIHFPYTVFMDDFKLELDDGAKIEAAKPQKQLLVYGDSISQGHDAIRPSRRYTAKIAEFLGAEEINKAIGGEVFAPGLAKIKQDFSPEYLLVAYGTNDWSSSKSDVFFSNAKSFYEILSNNYPNAKIFALSPIWRADADQAKPFGEFLSVEKLLKKAVAGLSNVRFISGFDFVPHECRMFGDLRLHPRDLGFDEYSENLAKKINEII